MTLDQVMAALAAKGSEATKKLLVKHGAQEPFFGVKIADLKPLHKTLKGNQAIALQLYATGNADAQFALAYALRRAGLAAEAISAFEAGLAIEPDRESARQALDALRTGQ